MGFNFFFFFFKLVTRSIRKGTVLDSPVIQQFKISILKLKIDTNKTVSSMELFNQ